MNGPGKRLRTISTLLDTHLGRTVTIKRDDGDLTGTLSGLIPVGDRVQAVLIVGGARVFTDMLDGDTHVEVWQKAAS